MPMEVILARMERAGRLVTRRWLWSGPSCWTRSGLTDVIEEWRKRQVARMFNLSEFVRCVKLRFCLFRRLCGNGFALFEPLTAVGSPGGITGSMAGGAPFGRSGLGR